MVNYCVELPKQEFTECFQILMDYLYHKKGNKWGLDTLTSVLIIMTVVGTSIWVGVFCLFVFFIF